MGFAIRRLILRSRIPNHRLTYRVSSLPHTSPSFSAASRIWQHRSFTATARYRKENDDRSPRKGSPVETVGEAIEPSVEPADVENETNADWTHSNSSADEESNDYFVPDPSKRTIENVRVWMEEIGLTDEELAYYVNTYPDIDAPTITQIKKGVLSEDDLLDDLEDDIREQEESLPKDQKAAFKIMEDNIKNLPQGFFPSPPSKQEYDDFGLLPEDLKRLEHGSPDDMDEGTAMRIKNALMKMGMTEDEFREMMEEDDEDEGEDEEEEEDEDGEESSPAEKFKSQFGLKEGELPTDEELDSFLESADEEMNIPDELKDVFKKAMKGDEAAMKGLLDSMSEEEIQALLEDEEGENDEDEGEDDEGEEEDEEEDDDDDDDNEGGDGEDGNRGAIDVGGRSKAIDAPKNSQNKAQMLSKLREMYAEAQSANSSGEDDASNLPKQAESEGDKGFEDWMMKLRKKGIDPLEMDTDEFLRAFEKETEKNSFWESDDGDVIRVHHVSTREQLADVRRATGEEPGSPAVAPRRKKSKFEKMVALEGDEEQEEGESDEAYMERKLGFLSKEEVEEAEKEREEPGFFNYGEENEDVGEDEEFQGDDLSAAGHAELEQHREIREYARLAAWELPLLHKLAKPFEPPDASQPLRFRYTTYMGEQHPASKKVVVEFCPKDLPSLSEPQTAKLIKLVGPRYNPSTNIVKMSCESFETQAQNKRYLGDLIETLMKTAKNEKDNFEDVPADFRHHTPKPFYEFPERWKLTPERRKVLEEKRVKVLQEEERRKIEGKVVDGVGVIESALDKLGKTGMRDLLEGGRLRETVPIAKGRIAVRGRVGQPFGAKPSF